MDPFNDLGIFRPGTGMSRRPPAPSSSTSEAEVQTQDQDDPMGLQGGEDQQSDDERSATPGTEATELSGNISEGGTFHLREPGHRPLLPVQEEGQGPGASGETEAPGPLNVVPEPPNQRMMGPNVQRGPNYKAPPAVLGPPPPPPIFTIRSPSGDADYFPGSPAPKNNFEITDFDPICTC